VLIINGKSYGVAGLAGTNFIEDPAAGLKIRRDCRLREPGTWVRGIVLHTRMGLPVNVREGRGPNIGWDQLLARRFEADDRDASCHIAIDADGSYACLADLQRVVTYHAEQVNDVSIGIEMYQAQDGGVWASTIAACVAVVDVITRVLSIQRQYPMELGLCRRFARPSVGVDPKQALAYMSGGARGRDFSGVYGHRNVTRNRGPGDPGDPVFVALHHAGYEAYLVDSGADLDVWSTRQRALGIPDDDCDGIVGRKTVELMRVAGHACGLWVERPGDEEHEASRHG